MINWKWTEEDTNQLFEICEKLRDNTPFAFSRWGDGEWIAVSKTYTEDKNKNANKSIYHESLGTRLKEIISEEKDYYIGHMKMPIADPYGNSLEHLKHEYPQNYINSDLLHGMSWKQGLSYIYELLDQIHVVYVGGEHLKQLPFVNEFIEIPASNVWENYDETLAYIKQYINNNQHKTFLFSAGMATNVFVDDLWNFNKNNTYMDVGSTFDPYVGVKSRHYMSQINTRLIDEVINKYHK